MNEAFVSILLLISGFLGVQSVPQDPDPHWRVEQVWQKTGDVFTFKATSTDIQQNCQGNSELVLQLPQVIHGVHEIRADGRVVFRSGDTTFKKSSDFYERPTVSCFLFQSANVIE